MLINEKHLDMSDPENRKWLIEQMDKLPDIANFVVPPHIAINIAKHIANLGIKHLWFQPGSESDELENWLKNTNEIKYLINSCIMVETR